MPPKRRSQTNPQPTLTQETVDQLVRDGIEADIKDERERVKMEATRAGGPAGGPTTAPMLENMENTFEISECAEGKKVKFAVTPPKWATAEYDVPGALLHNITAEDTREQPLNMSFK
nr:hypothetical protein [Tanacetum cinerariifolium]